MEPVSGNRENIEDQRIDNNIKVYIYMIYIRIYCFYPLTSFNVISINYGPYK